MIIQVNGADVEVMTHPEFSFTLLREMEMCLHALLFALLVILGPALSHEPISGKKYPSSPFSQNTPRLTGSAESPKTEKPSWCQFIASCLSAG